MIPVVTVEQIRAIEAAADANNIMSYSEMMETAGRTAAERAYTMTKGLKNPRVTILTGAGNNGGDGLVAGRYLAQMDETIEVRFYLLKRLDEDKNANFKQVLEMGLFLAYEEDDHDKRVLRNMAASADLLIDALFGIGVRLPIKDEAAKVLRNVNQALNQRRAAVPDEMTIFPAQPAQSTTIPPQKVLAIDCPSGLDCDTGELDSNTIHADETITFIAPKTGLLQYPGAEAVGTLSIATIGIPHDMDEFKATNYTLATARGVKSMLPPRSSDSNKGTYGKVMIVAGSVNYAGAPGLAAKAAYRAGAGLVTVGAPPQVVATLAAQLPEPTWLMLAQDMGVLSENAAELVFKELQGYKALLLGPGWGQEDTTGDLLKKLLEKPEELAKKSTKRSLGFMVDDKPRDEENTATTNELPPLVIDADGLNLLAKTDNWWDALPQNTIITPHPGEMARLAQMETSEVQANRLQLALDKAAAWQTIILLKGAHTVIAAPDGQISILPFKNDALATAGTGDVLAGIITGFVAQGSTPFEAAVLGGYVHGLAGELATQKLQSGRGVIAGDLIDLIPIALGVIENS